MIPDLTTPEGRMAIKEATEKTIRLAMQRGSATVCTQHSQDVIEDAKIMLAVLDVAENQAKELKSLRALADAAGDLDAEMIGVGSTQTNEFVIARALVVNRIHEAWIHWKTEQSHFEPGVKADANEP